MMMMMFLHALLVLILVSQVQGRHTLARPCGPLIRWSSGCDQYSVSEGVYPSVGWFHEHSRVTLMSECRTLCTEDRECGGFSWVNGGTCYLYNINEKILSEQFTGADMFTGDAHYTWYSKTCPYDTGATDPTCNIYANTVPINTYIANVMVSGFAHSPNNLTPTHCQSWCTTYTGCKSVSHTWRRSDGLGACHLRDTTVEGLRAAGRDDKVLVYNGSTDFSITNYVRFCADGSRYIPDCNPTTTTQAATTTTQAATTTTQATTTTTQVTTTTTQAAPTPNSGIILRQSVCGIVSGLTVTMITMYLFPLH